MNVQERPVENFALGDLLGDTGTGLPATPLASASGLFGPWNAALRADTLPSAASAYAAQPAGGGWSDILNKLFGIIADILNLLGLQQPNPVAQGRFGSADASSTGDPHLAFSGTRSDGTQDDSHFDSMASHADLLDSDSFQGGFQISTQVTQPDARGITWNQSAAVTTAGGATQVGLDAGGNATIVQNGQQIAIGDGQTVDLGDGETVTRNADGSLAIDESNGMGASIVTTLRENGRGVDVHVRAQNVDLGGDLLNGSPTSPPLHPLPPLPPVVGPPGRWVRPL